MQWNILTIQKHSTHHKFYRKVTMMSTAMNNFSYLKDQIYQFQFFGKIRGLWILPEKEWNFFISGWVHKTLVSSNLQANKFWRKNCQTIYPAGKCPKSKKPSGREKQAWYFQIQFLHLYTMILYIFNIQ